MSDKLNSAPISKGVSETPKAIEANDKLPEPSKLKEKLLTTPQLREFLKAHPDLAKRLDVLDSSYRNALSSAQEPSIQKNIADLYNTDYLVSIERDFKGIELGLSWEDESGLQIEPLETKEVTARLNSCMQILSERLEAELWKTGKMIQSITTTEVKIAATQEDKSTAQEVIAATQENKSAAQENKTIEEVKIAGVQVDASTTEKDKKWVSEKDRLFKEKADLRLKNFYELFGDESKFEEKFKGSLPAWRDDVAKDLRTAGVVPGSPNYEQKLALSVLSKYQGEIGLQLDPAKRDSFKSLIDTTRAEFKDDIIAVPFRNNSGIITDAIKNGSTSGSDAKYTKMGDTIYRGDEVFTIKGTKIEKSLRSDSGITVPMGSIALPDHVATIKRQALLSHMKTLTGKKDFDGSKRSIDTFKEDTKTQIGDIKNTLSIDQKKLEGLKSTKERLDQEKPVDFENTDKLTKIIGEIEELENVIKSREKTVEKTEVMLGVFTAEAEEFQGLSDKDETDLPAYQERIKNRDEWVRDNLKYLESTHLAWLLGDSGMNLFIAQINDHKDSYIQGSSELRLQTLWGPVEKNLFALGLKKLLWLDPKEMNAFFEPNGFDLRKFTDPPMKDMIKGKLKESGTYGGQPPALSREKLINVMNGAKKE